MNSTFIRATIGFLTLTLCLTLFCAVGLWASAEYLGNIWWVGAIIILFGMCIQIGIYSNTLHDPVIKWIKEPQQRLDDAREAAQEAARDARYRARENNKVVPAYQR